MPGTPQQVSAIKMNTFYSKNIPHIPFCEQFDNEGGSNTYYYVVLKIEDGSVTSFSEAEGSTHYKDIAVDNFIEHYVPGFYPFVVGAATPAEQFTWGSDYSALRQGILDSLATLNYRSLLGQLPKVIYSTSYPLSSQPDIPPGVVGVERFHNLSSTSIAVDGTTTLDLTTFPMLQGEFSSFMSTFSNQLNNFEGQLNLNLNFNFLQTGVENILQVIIGTLTKYMEHHSRPGGYQAGDQLVIDFNAQNKIIKIQYVLGSEQISATTGFITNIKYNDFFNDPLTLSTLKNYETIIETNRDSSQLTEQSSFIDFISDTFDVPGGSNPVNFNGPHTPDNATGPWNNIFANRDSEDLIDIGDIDRINKIFSTFKSAEELRQIEDYLSDPQVRKMALQQEKAKRINAAIAVTDVVDKVLKFEFPLAGLNDTKEGRVINQIINQFGIQELAKEALICLTAGTTVSLSRISTAVKNELMNMSSAPLYTAPRNPPNLLERPSLGDFKAYFSITGDPPLYKQILDIVLNALANAAFEIIKSIADMIKYNCDDIFQEDIGSMAAGEELQARMQPNSQFQEIPAIPGGIADEFWAPPPPDHMDHLEHLFLAIGFETVSAGFLYLNLVSGVLNPSEICKLFNSPQDVAQETLDRIVAYNRTYPEDPAAMKNLDTYTAITNFFFEAAKLVDTTSLCNDYLNSVAERLQKGDWCPVCFDDGAFADNPAINELVNIIEGDIPMEIYVPEFDFTCPDSEYFLNNPVITAVIPNLFYTLIESIQLYMGSSIEAARTSMLQPTVTNRVNDELASAMSAAGVEMEPTEFNPEVLDMIMNVFSSIADVLEDMNDPALCPDVDLSTLPNIQMMLEVLSTISDVMVAVAPELAAAAEEINEKIGTINTGSVSDPLGNPAPFVQYVFNEDYKDRFRYAIRPIDFTQTSTDPNAYIGYPVSAPAGSSADLMSLNKRDYNIARSYTAYAGAQLGSTFITFNFDLDAAEGAEAAIKFPSYSDYAGNGWIELIVNDSQMLYGDLGVTFNGTHDFTNPDYDTFTTALSNPSYETNNINPFVARFTDVLPLTAHTVLGTPDFVDSTFTPGGGTENLDAAGILFPEMFLSKLKNMFDYILNKGAFSEYKLSRLNFFKDNANCSPGNVGDLMDADGIIDQMQQEMAAAACEGDSTVQDKIKAVVRYGIINLLIQAYIVEFIVNNIIVFSAFNMIDIFHPKYGFKSFMMNAVTESLVSLIERVDPPGSGVMFASSQRTLRGIIQNYLSKRMDRLPGVGIISTDGLVNFDTQEQLEAAPLSDLVKFLVDERINHVWLGGTRDTIKSINNIVDPANARPRLEDIYLEHVIQMYPKFSADPIPTDVGTMTVLTDVFDNFEWYPRTKLPGGTWLAVPYGELFFSRSVTYTDSAGAEVTQSAYHFSIEVGITPAAPSGPFEASEGNTNFRKSYTLYYVLPQVAGAFSAAPDLTGYAGFDFGVPDTWTPLATVTGDLLGPNPTTSNNAELLAAFYEFVSSGQTANNLSTLWFGQPAASAVTIAQVLASQTAELNIMKSDVFKIFLEQIANKDAMFAIANLYNFHLTRTYFPAVRGSFDTVKQAILNLLHNVNATEAFPSPVPPSTVPALQAEMATGGQSNLDSLMREIMLKVLRETPIAILKGLVELIDPHISISKLIRDITGVGFGKAADILDIAVSNWPMPPGPGIPAGSTLGDMGITGTNILGLAFCGLNVVNQQASQLAAASPNAPTAAEDGPLLGPKFTMEGIDFKGTVAGMFMAPPSPLGILYLLFSMLENLDIPVDDPNALPQLDMLEAPDSNSC